jgi:hypothetical protein
MRRNLDNDHTVPSEHNVTQALKLFAQDNQYGHTSTGAGNIAIWANNGWITTAEQYKIALDALENSPRKDSIVVQALKAIGLSAIENTSDSRSDPSYSPNQFVTRVLHQLVAIQNIYGVVSDYQIKATEEASKCEQDVLSRIGQIRYSSGSRHLSLKDIQDSLLSQMDCQRICLEQVRKIYSDAIDVGQQTGTYPFADPDALRQTNHYFFCPSDKLTELCYPRFDVATPNSLHANQMMTGVYVYMSPLAVNQNIPLAPNDTQSATRARVLWGYKDRFETLPRFAGQSLVMPEETFSETIRYSNFHSQLFNVEENIWGQEAIATEFALCQLSDHDQSSPGKYQQLKQTLVNAMLEHCEAEGVICKITEALNGSNNSTTEGLVAKEINLKRQALEEFNKLSLLDRVVKYKNNIENLPLQKEYRIAEFELKNAQVRLVKAQQDFIITSRRYLEANSDLVNFVNNNPVFAPEEVESLKDVYRTMELGFSYVQNIEQGLVLSLREHQRAVEALRQFQKDELTGTLPVRHLGHLDAETLSFPTPNEVLSAIAFFRKYCVLEQPLKISNRSEYVIEYVASLTKELLHYFQTHQLDLESARKKEDFDRHAVDIMNIRSQFMPQIVDVYMEKYAQLEEQAIEAIQLAQKLQPPQAVLGVNFVLGSTRI